MGCMRGIDVPWYVYEAREQKLDGSGDDNLEVRTFLVRFEHLVDIAVPDCDSSIERD